MSATAPQVPPASTGGEIEPAADQQREAKRAALLARQQGELQAVLRRQLELTGRDPLLKGQSPEKLKKDPSLEEAPGPFPVIPRL